MSAPDPDKVQYLGDVLRLELKPGDWLVLKLAKPVTLQQRAHLREALDRAGFDGRRNRVLILEDGADLGVLASTEEPPLDVRTLGDA